MLPLPIWATHNFYDTISATWHCKNDWANDFVRMCFWRNFSIDFHRCVLPKWNKFKWYHRQKLIDKLIQYINYGAINASKASAHIHYGVINAVDIIIAQHNTTQEWNSQNHFTFVHNTLCSLFIYLSIYLSVTVISNSLQDSDMIRHGQLQTIFLCAVWFSQEQCYHEM